MRRSASICVSPGPPSFGQILPPPRRNTSTRPAFAQVLAHRPAQPELGDAIATTRLRLGVLVANLGHNPTRWWLRTMEYMGLTNLHDGAPFHPAAPLTAVRSYREAMAEFAQMSTLDIWYAHRSESEILAAVGEAVPGA